MKKEKYARHLKILSYGCLGAMVIFYALFFVIISTIEPPFSIFLGIGVIGAALLVKYILGLLVVKLWRRL